MGTEPKPEEPATKLTFQQKVVLPLAALMQDAFKEVPELRSACIVLDWHDNINEAVRPCMWFDKNGSIEGNTQNHGDAIVGSMSQLMKAFAEQAEAGLRLIEAYGITIQQKEELLANVESRLNEQGEKLEALGDAGQQACGEEGSTGVGKKPTVDPDGTED